jgi:heavy metal sensor kinase
MALNFRLRLFLLGMLTVTASLAVVLYSGWSSLVAYETRRLDARLCIEARRLAAEPHHGEDIGRLENDLISKLRLRQSEHLMFRFGDQGQGQQAYRSSRWSDAVLMVAHTWEPVTGVGARLDECESAESRADGHSWRFARMVNGPAESVVGVELAAALGDLQAALRNTLVVIVPFSLLLSGLVAWLLSSVAVRPIGRLRNAMRQVGQGSLDRRLGDTGEDTEFRELIATYNAMLERLEVSFEQASRFSADAAHELQTPLTILRGRIEEARRLCTDHHTTEDLDELMDEVGRLASIVQKLLLLSRADAGKLTLHRQRIDLSAILNDLVVDAQMLILEQTLSSSIHPGLTVLGDPTLLRQLLNNLISNAVRYCTETGWIKVNAHLQGGSVVLSFGNSCRPILEAERNHLFDRFYRGDAARNRRAGGSGLGLSIAREIARAHTGALTLEPSPPNEMRLNLTLPCQ